MANVDLRRLRYFVAVAEERHFGRAAARLHMSTPPLSQRIRELEGELGLALFERTSRSVELTDAGARLLPDARAVLQAVERFEHSAEQLSAAGSELTFGYCYGSEDGAMRSLRRFHDEHPEVLVHPASMTSLQIAEQIAAGRVAVGIVRGTVDADQRVATVPLARVPVDHVSLPVGHALASADAVHATDLDGERVLVVERAAAPHAHDVFVDYLGGLGVRVHWVTHGALQLERVFDMVAIGAGIGWVNRWQAERDTGRSDVEVRRLEPVGMWDEFRVAWRQGDTRLATAACVRVVLETCGS
jgi:DNA-binding transcriptional LysR family regulator